MTPRKYNINKIPQLFMHTISLMLGLRAGPARGVGKGGVAELLCIRFRGDRPSTSFALLQASGVAGNVPAGHRQGRNVSQSMCSIFGSTPVIGMGCNYSLKPVLRGRWRLRPGQVRVVDACQISKTIAL